MTSPSHVGIDVSKEELVVSTTTALVGRFANDRGGHRALVERLKQDAVALIVVESTGRYGQDVAVALFEAGQPVAVVQPGRVRHFAGSLGIRAKSDPIDAEVIARFGEATRPRLFTPTSVEIAALRVLVDRRDQVIDMRVQIQGQLEACTDRSVRNEMRRLLRMFEQREVAYGKKIAQHIAKHERLARLDEALRAESGVGPVTASVLIAHLPELGQVNRQEVAALAGLAPYNRDSGRMAGKRMISGGRKRLRMAMYMAALSAAQRNPGISDMYRRLIAKGKPSIVARIACGRKLLVRLNSIAAKILATPAPPQIA